MQTDNLKTIYSDQESVLAFGNLINMVYDFSRSLITLKFDIDPPSFLDETVFFFVQSSRLYLSSDCGIQFASSEIKNNISNSLADSQWKSLENSLKIVFEDMSHSLESYVPMILSGNCKSFTFSKNDIKYKCIITLSLANIAKDGFLTQENCRLYTYYCSILKMGYEDTLPVKNELEFNDRHRNINVVQNGNINCYTISKFSIRPQPKIDQNAYTQVDKLLKGEKLEKCDNEISKKHEIVFEGWD
jgi:hypothetical protein